MAVQATIQSVALVKITPRGGANPVAINPAQVLQVIPDNGGATILLTGPNSGRVTTDMTVDQVVAAFTPA